MEKATSRRLPRGATALLCGACVFTIATLSGLGSYLPVAGTTQDTDKPVQAENAKQDDKSTGKKKTGGLRVPVGRVPKNRKKAGNDEIGELAAAANPAPAAKANPNGVVAKGKANVAGPQMPVWPFHYTLKMLDVGGEVLTAAYYPARGTFEAPVLILLHESGSGRASKDFSEPIEDLKGKGFARHLQEQGFAVFVLNLRQPAGNAQSNSQAWRAMVGDLQIAYRFLLDRHNRGEFNLAKLGVVALGDSANLAAAWAASPGGAVSNEGRLSDLGAIVLVSPLNDVPGIPLSATLPAIATRFPLLAMCGDRDLASLQAVRDNQRVIERHRLSRVAFFDTTLHGGKLLTFFPKTATNIERFFDDPVKNRKVEWEPRFLLDPVPYQDVQLIPDSGFTPIPQAGNAAPPAINEQPKAPAAKERNKAQ